MTKITDLTDIGTVASADWLPILDVSDTTQSAGGTTKKVSVRELSPVPSFGWFPTAGNYNYTLPGNTLWFEVFLCSGGGGGGSGRRGPDATTHVACGGGGGGGGCMANMRFLAADLPSLTMSLVVGAGQSGAAAVTTDNTNGNTSVGNGGTSALVDSNGVWIAQTYVTGPGGGGTINTGSAGFTEANVWGANGNAGTAASTTGLVGGAPNVSAGPGGGCPGGGISGAVPVASLGGGGTWVLMGSKSLDNLVTWKGVIDSVAPTGPTTRPYRGMVGPSTAGGWSSVTGNAAAGVNGIFGAGGGGGGASLNGHNSGAGGNGGDGFVMITPHFG